MTISDGDQKALEGFAFAARLHGHNVQLVERSPEARAAYLEGFNAAVEMSAQILDGKAHDYNVQRDPGMANHCRAVALTIRKRTIR